MTEFGKNYSKIPVFNIVLKKNAERIVNKINQEDHFLAYVRKVSDDKITKLFDLTDYFNSSLDRTLDDLKSYSEYDHKFKIEFKNIMTELIDKMGKYSFELKRKRNYDQDDLYGLINEGIIHYQEILEIDAEDFLLFRANFFDPMLIYLMEFRAIPEIYDICQLASNANKLLSAILINSKKAAERLELLKKDLEGQLGLFDRSIKSLNEYLVQRNLKVVRLRIRSIEDNKAK